ncbi:RING finger and CHY zinc finger domain-containing protein 1 isoform X3 [Erinaceus europaeus]|uniref:RING finger and CHY zinc finger domain-containing protein 1 isoform X3 n=1 Tax=Erinaceus europaeus TaxID=9365 RepID=A0ABM3X4V2_ERIEU|nr:RING finger and CHY zinc finger domain-containing protein 1 isoform X3 [Erinaceus europaeus]
MTPPLLVTTIMGIYDILILFFFFLRIYLFIHERDRRERARHHSGTCAAGDRTQDLMVENLMLYPLRHLLDHLKLFINHFHSQIGPKEDFFHCLKCNLCLALSLQGKHKCIENVSRQNCPICLEDIHTSRVVAHVLPCGHLLHRTCYEEMLKEGYRCPLCMHSALDMTRYWRQLDDEVAQTPMPSEYQNMTVDILCNDCNGRSTVQFHILGMKCTLCDSYNTAQAGGCRASLDQQ